MSRRVQGGARGFLIATTALELRLTSIKINDLRFSNRDRMAISPVESALLSADACAERAPNPLQMMPGVIATPVAAEISLTHCKQRTGTPSDRYTFAPSALANPRVAPLSCARPGAHATIKPSSGYPIVDPGGAIQ